MVSLLSKLGEDRILRLQRRQLKPAIVLTAVLVSRVFMLPVIDSGTSWLHPVNQAITAIALGYMAATTRRHLEIAATLTLVIIGIQVAALLGLAPPALDHVQAVTFIALLVYVFWLMLRDLFLAREADATTMLLAVNCYLLIGVLWAVFYTLTETLAPGSFALTGNGPAWKDLYYFSFVTLTTLGYGDIQPLSPLARSLAMTEAIAGVMFTGILVARLVGMYAAPRSRD
jgi:voltage-gated potassium channel